MVHGYELLTKWDDPPSIFVWGFPAFAFVSRQRHWAVVPRRDSWENRKIHWLDWEAGSYTRTRSFPLQEIQSHHLGVIGMTGPPQKNILKHLLQLRRYDRYGCKFKGNPCRLHTETWEGGKETWRMFIFWWWSMQTKLGLKHEHVTPQKKNKKMGGEKRNFRERVCVCEIWFSYVFLKTNPTLPWELVTAFHGSTSFSEGKFYRVDFWKNTFQATKNPPWRASMKTSGFCLPILEKPNKIQQETHGSVDITLRIPMGIRFWEQRWFGDLFGVRLRLDDFCWEISKGKCLERILETSWNEIEGKDM